MDQVLVSSLIPLDVVVTDNHASHKGPAVREASEAVRTGLPYLPPNSPDLNPIANA